MEEIKKENNSSFWLEFIKKPLEFLQEDNGRFSWARAVAAWGIFWSMRVVRVWIETHPEASALDVVTIIAGAFGVFIGLKLGQKPMEKNN